MITEDYVSFEVAKLLKEKGFNWEWSPFYSEQDRDEWDRNNNYNIPNPNYDANIPFDSETLNVIAPHVSLQMAMKWLREIHKKVINVDYIDFLEHGEVWSYYVLDRNTFHEFTEKSESFTEHSYEEACEAAIKYCLENLVEDEN